MGKTFKTKGGINCQRWDQQSPHNHVIGITNDEFPDDTVADAGSYCRNPVGYHSGGPWCYTSNKLVRFDYCNVSLCDCKTTDKGETYMAYTNTTLSGKTCQRWDSQTPHSHDQTDASKFPDRTIFEASNYCRNPDGKQPGPWCFTTDNSTRWEFCNIPYCDITIPKNGSSTTPPPTPTGCPTSIGRRPTDLPNIGSTYLHLMVSMSFPCDTAITRVDYFRSNPNTPVFVSIWRRRTTFKFTLVSRVELPASQTGQTTVNIDTPMQVRQG
ncbi:unnamed protein product, partial [Owenia fusiformis]